MIRFLLYALLFLPTILFGEISWHATHPGGFSAAVTISNPNITIHDQLSLRLSLAFPKGYHIDPVALKMHLLRHNPLKPAPFQLLSADSDHLVKPDGSIVQNIHYLLQPQLTGEFLLSFLNISFFSDDPQSKDVEIISDLFEVHTAMVPLKDPFNIGVGPLLRLSPEFPISMSPENRRNLFGIDSIKEAAQYNLEVFRQTSFPWWSLLFVIAIILLTWAVKESRQKRPNKPEYDFAKGKRAEDNAIHALNLINEEKWPEQEKFMQFYIALTNAVRKFIEEKYHLHAPTLTTQEFLMNSSKYPGFDQEMRNRLNQFLNSADQVKFAKYSPSVEECRHAMQNAKALISPVNVADKSLQNP